MIKPLAKQPLKNPLNNDFKINGQVDIVIKLSYIWANNNKYGLSSSMYQIKYYAPPDQLDINFIDIDDTINVIDIVKPEKYIYSTPVFKPNIILQDKKLPQQISVIPSLQDLQCALKSLKSLKDKTKD